jgi:hypothetical protein
MFLGTIRITESAMKRYITIAILPRISSIQHMVDVPTIDRVPLILQKRSPFVNTFRSVLFLHCLGTAITNIIMPPLSWWHNSVDCLTYIAICCPNAQSGLWIPSPLSGVYASSEDIESVLPKPTATHQQAPVRCLGHALLI